MSSWDIYTLSSAYKWKCTLVLKKMSLWDIYTLSSVYPLKETITLASKMVIHFTKIK
jgi:hypothetical protein